MSALNHNRVVRELRAELPPGNPERVRSLLAGVADRAADHGLLDVGYGPVDSPLGRLLVAATPVGVVRVGFESEPDEQILGELAVRVSPRVLKAPRLVDAARRQLNDYFEGALVEFQLPLDWRLTAGFRRQVLRATSRIPYGSTRTYREVATTAGSRKAVRAAGTALAKNPLPIIVPCHRVLRTDGGLGGYRGGTAAKRALLDHEQTQAPGGSEGSPGGRP
jgi:methylated-DNA-[protein]-cysteine S-methyltransferase